MKNHYYLHHRHPSGITLIEVMFASGIALFGVLVVVALIPLAGNELRIGLQTDRMAALGRNAVKEFDIRGMRDPKQWCDHVGNSVYSPTTPRAYAIDPRFLLNPLNKDLATGNLKPKVNHFPYSNRTDVTIHHMTRISLQTKYPGLDHRWHTADDSTPVFQKLTKSTADQLFVARDDLILKFPDDRTMISKPVWGGKRQFRGELSWMATVVPVPSRNPLNHEYVLSIIVFSSRNMALEKYDNVDATVANVAERTASVVLVGGGFAGGEVKLSHPIPTTINNKNLYAENILKLQTNNWVMLSGTSGSRTFYRWYRVLNVGSVSVAGSTASRFVTLQGADWDPTKIVDTQATIMEGVVGVFEKRIRLENSSLW